MLCGYSVDSVYNIVNVFIVSVNIEFLEDLSHLIVCECVGVVNLFLFDFL